MLSEAKHLKPIYVLLGCLLFSAPGSADVIYVNHAATGLANGTSWTNAFPDLHDALNTAGTGDEIWIAKGTYKPNRGTGDRMLSFELKAGVPLYGGFAGHEISPLQRNIAANETILSGDLNGDDGPYDCSTVSDCCSAHDSVGCDNSTCEDIICARAFDCCDPIFGEWDEYCAELAKSFCCDLSTQNCENSYHVLLVPSTWTEVEVATLDGLTVTGGYAYDETCETDPFNCCTLCNYGGALHGYGEGNLVVRDCVFRANGGGIAGIWWLGVSSATLDSVTMTDNRVAALDLGCINQPGVTSLTVTNSIFNENVEYGARFSCNAIFSNCVFSDNTEGFTLWAVESDLIVEGCLFENNHDFYTVYADGSGDVEIIDSVFRGNSLCIEAGFGSSPIVRNCLFEDNVGLPARSSGDLTMDDCLFTGNYGPVAASDGLLEVNSCVFLGNGSEFGGGGVSAGNDATALVTDCLFSGNSSVPAPTVQLTEDAFASFTNCTFVGNDSVYSSLIEVGREAGISLDNCILWDNCVAGICDQSAQAFIFTGGVLDIHNSTLQGWTGSLGGVGNNGADPVFIDADGPDDTYGTLDDNPRLSPDSPAIDSGDPDFVPDAGETDLDGHARVLCGQIDRGAYESGIGDADCNRTVDLNDVSAMQRCFTGVNFASNSSLSLRMTGSPLRMTGCESFDFNNDGYVDLDDASSFNAALTGP